MGTTKDLPQSLPQYPEMIFKAISALNEETGLNKSTISYYIESTYGDLPAGHSELLTQHLDKLEEIGELVYVKNNYMRPNPDSPPKRGRGRPSEPKSSAAMALAAAKAGPSRGRGRPRKPKSAAEIAKAAAKAAYVGPPRGRGRPPKPKSAAELALAAAKAALAPVRGRGRPRKPKSAATMALAAAKAAYVGPPRGRGRPPKNKDAESSGVAEKRKVSEPSGRPRGRPKKVKSGEGEGEGDDDDDDEEEGDVTDANEIPGVVPAGGGAVPGAGLNVTGSPRPRGRPPKVKTPFGDVGF